MQQSYESDWHSSHLGSPKEGGFRLDQIRWKDLGRKFVTKLEVSSQHASFEDTLSELEYREPSRTEHVAG